MEEILDHPGEEVPAEVRPKPKPRGRVRTYLESEEGTRYTYLAFAFLAIAIVTAMIQYRTDAICCGDWDGYYHIRWSSLLWESFSSGKWLPTFEWLPFTVLNPERYNDHHFLFHLLQIPFLWFFDDVTAAKVAAIVFATLAIFSLYWLIHRYRIKYPLLWLAALFTCANMFYYRMAMAKAPPLTIVITVIGIYLLFERRYVWLLPLTFAFVWTYSLFPLLLIAAVIWAAIVGWNERRFEWRPIAYTLGGIVLGNVINPYFPNNLLLFWEHFITKFKVGSDFAVAVGGEWYPFTGMELLTHFPVAIAAMVLGYVLFVPRNGRLPEKATFFLVFVSVLCAAQFRSKRFAEYFPPFAILFAAFSWDAFVNWRAMEKDRLSAFEMPKPGPRLAEWMLAMRQASIWLIGIVLLGYFFVNMIGLAPLGIDQPGLLNTIKDNEPDQRYRRAMAWAQTPSPSGENNIPAGEIIFNCNWDDFPKLFFLNTQNRYVYGLDPNYLFSQNPELYRLLIDITEAKTDEAGPVIRERFNSRYIFADARENQDMIKKGLESGWMEVVYKDDEATILKIRDEKGDAAPNEAPADAQGAA